MCARGGVITGRDKEGQRAFTAAFCTSEGGHTLVCAKGGVVVSSDNTKGAAEQVREGGGVTAGRGLEGRRATMAEVGAGEGGRNSACATGGVAMTSVCSKGAAKNARTRGGVIAGRGQEGRGQGERDEGGSHGTNGKWRTREGGDGRSKVGGDGRWGGQMATGGKGGGNRGTKQREGGLARGERSGSESSGGERGVMVECGGGGETDYGRNEGGGAADGGRGGMSMAEEYLCN